MGNKPAKNDDAEIEEALNRNGLEFDNFEVLRSIGKGSFGKVCIVQMKKKSSQVYAMKYMNKIACWKQGMLDHVLDELRILEELEHTFIVNLWFTFQDDEDIFMVSDLMLGGDLRYHIQRHEQFSTEDIKVYLCEMASVLDYLKGKHIIHRDIKPDNILLDDKGHVHLTDFNVAKYLNESEGTAKNFAGTKPYAAPEVFASSLGSDAGYSYSVDWWSLGVTIYELLRHKRPFAIDQTSNAECLEILKRGTISLPSDWSPNLKDVFIKFFKSDLSKRVCSLTSLHELPLLSSINPHFVIKRKLKPTFIPAQNHLNYDPTYELEEMIIESNPLHKKKQRITKRKKERAKKLERMLSEENSITLNRESVTESVEEEAMQEIVKKFRPFNRRWKQLQSNAPEEKSNSLPIQGDETQSS